MFWLIITILGIIAFIIGIIWKTQDKWSEGAVITLLVGFFCAIIFGLISIVEVADERALIEKHEILSQEAMNYDFNNEYEKAIAFQQKKEFNDKLIDTKSYIDSFSIFYFYPDEIKNLEFLK